MTETRTLDEGGKIAVAGIGEGVLVTMDNGERTLSIVLGVRDMNWLIRALSQAYFTGPRHSPLRGVLPAATASGRKDQ